MLFNNYHHDYSELDRAYNTSPFENLLHSRDLCLSINPDSVSVKNPVIQTFFEIFKIFFNLNII